MFHRRKCGVLIQGSVTENTGFNSRCSTTVSVGFNRRGGLSAPSFLERKDTMLKFYDIDPAYANYLRQFDQRIPNINYGTNNKFVCGIVLSVSGYNYFAPISSNTARQQTNILITDDTGRVLSSIKFSFMFPAPTTVITPKNFRAIRAVDSAYADLLEKEYEFCKKNEQAIRDKAMKVYRIGCNPGHVLHRNCCDFHLLEEKQDEWIAAQNVVAGKNQETQAE